MFWLDRHCYWANCVFVMDDEKYMYMYVYIWLYAWVLYLYFHIYKVGYFYPFWVLMRLEVNKNKTFWGNLLKAYPGGVTFLTILHPLLLKVNGEGHHKNDLSAAVFRVKKWIQKGIQANYYMRMTNNKLISHYLSGQIKVAMIGEIYNGFSLCCCFVVEFDLIIVSEYKWDMCCQFSRVVLISIRTNVGKSHFSVVLNLAFPIMLKSERNSVYYFLNLNY